MRSPAVSRVISFAFKQYGESKSDDDDLKRILLTIFLKFKNEPVNTVEQLHAVGEFEKW
jgi:hypothetical protein